MPDEACPEHDRLAALLSGDVSTEEQDRLVRHVESCTRCQQMLDRLSASAWEQEARSLADGEPCAGEPRLRQLLSTMLRRYSGPTVTLEETAEERGDEIPTQLGAYRLLAFLGKGCFG